MASAFTLFEKRIFAIATGLVPIALLLSRIHSGFIILTIPFCFGLFFVLAAVISPWLFKKEFVPPSRSDTEEEIKLQTWSDHVLIYVAIVAGVLLIVCVRSHRRLHQRTESVDNGSMGSRVDPLLTSLSKESKPVADGSLNLT